ncbi:MAG: PAS domain S-box protein [Nitrospiraceae bacterium]|nr:PAS domain S-box protein [Nitrospiraceae bacterium]
MDRESEKQFLVADKSPETGPLYRALFEQSPDGILIIDTHGNFLEFNEEAHVQLGYSREEFAKLAIKDIDPVESPEQIQTSIDRILKTGLGDFEVKHRTKAGELRDVQAIVKAIDLAGSKILQCIWRDITERKRAEEALRRSKEELEAAVRMRTLELVGANRALEQELTERKRAEESLRQSEEKLKVSLKEKEVLLREIYHRTKNNMQVIISLIKLQLASVTNDKTMQMFNDTQNRIMSMAIVHEKLYKSKDLSNVNLKTYLNDLAGSLLESYKMSQKISLTIAAEDILLCIDVITPLGLIINELMTNSLKYAFPDGRKGEIRIDAHLASNGEMEVHFADNGAGFPEGFDLRNAKSLGLRLVRSLAEMQLGGKIELKSNKGAEFVIWFKDLKRNKRPCK